jgi:hypothetical protein
VSCHSGSDFSDSSSGLLHNVGTIKPGSGKRLGATLTGFDTPTLKGLWETAPYLHDGSAATLMDVLTVANPGNQHGNTSGLTATQLSQLVAYLQQIDDGSGTPPAVVISALSVKDTANAADWSIRSNLQVGNQQYGDRTYTFTSVPAIVVGAQWIRSANDSKAFTANPTVTFSINQPAEVYLAVDDRSTLPWMTGWTNTGVKMINSESTPKPYTLFRKSFPAGTVSLGPTVAPGSMYTVIVK